MAKAFGVDYSTMMRAMDKDGDGTLGVDEYVGFLLGHCLNGLKRGEVKQGVLKLLTLGGQAVERRSTVVANRTRRLPVSVKETLQRMAVCLTWL